MSQESMVLDTFSALHGQDDATVAHGFLLASVYAVAVRTDTTPRSVLDNLFKSLPSDESWPNLRAALLQLDE